MIDYSTFISPIAGAAIGYFTNWLAIKMLFFPYTEKKLFSKTLPFTPGLIPKERLVMSKKLGEVAEEYILTDEALMEYINAPETIEKLEIILDSEINKLKNSNFTLEETLSSLLNIDIDSMNNKSDDFIYKIMEGYIFDNSKIEELTDIITSNFIEWIRYKDVSEYTKIFAEYFRSIKDNTLNLIYEKNTLNEIFNEIKDKNLMSYMSFESSENIKDIVKDSIPQMLEKLYCLTENKEIDSVFRKFVKKTVSDNVGSFAGLFINSDKIYDSIKKNIYEYISDSENQLEIKIKVNNFTDYILSSSFTELYDKTPESIKKFLFQKSTKDTLERLIDDLISVIEKRKFNLDLYDFIYSCIPDFDLRVKNFVRGILNDDLKNFILNKLFAFFKNIKNKIMNLKISYIFSNILLNNFDDVNETIVKIINFTAVKGGNIFIKNIKVSKIIEEKINSLKIEMVKEIIESVAKKELNAITYVGGVLGFIIGLIPMFIQFWS